MKTSLVAIALLTLTTAFLTHADDGKAAPKGKLREPTATPADK